ALRFDEPHIQALPEGSRDPIKQVELRYDAATLEPRDRGLLCTHARCQLGLTDLPHLAQLASTPRKGFPGRGRSRCLSAVNCEELGVGRCSDPQLVRVVQVRVGLAEAYQSRDRGRGWL